MMWVRVSYSDRVPVMMIEKLEARIIKAVHGLVLGSTRGVNVLAERDFHRVQSAEFPVVDFMPETYHMISVMDYLTGKPY